MKSRKHQCAEQPARRRALKGALVGLSVVLLAACASLGVGSPEKQVEDRANARWSALSKRDFRSAYGVLAPSVRELVTYERWVSRHGTSANWKSAEVVGVTCEPARCTARIRIEAYPVGPSRKMPLIRTHMDETWVLEDGRWWLFQKL